MCIEDQKLHSLREKIQKRLAEKVKQKRLRKEQSTYRHPRYDYVFFEGVKWLDSQ